MIRYKDLLKKEDIVNFAFSSSKPNVHDLDLFLESKTVEKYKIVRKLLLLRLYEQAKKHGEISEDILDELNYLGLNIQQEREALNVEE